jgi:hypothetical protein
LFQISQLSKCIDDDTEKDVDHNDDNQNVECAVKEELYKEHFIVVVSNRECCITNTTTRTKTNITHFNETLEHCCAEVFIRCVLKFIDVEINICILKIKETNS